MSIIDPLFPVPATKQDWVEVLTGIITMTCLNHSITHNCANNVLTDHASMIAFRMRSPPPQHRKDTTALVSTWFVDRFQSNLFMHTPLVSLEHDHKFYQHIDYHFDTTPLRDANIKLIETIKALDDDMKLTFRVWNMNTSIQS